LMAMSLFATGAGVMKIIYSNQSNGSSDPFRDMMPVFLWCRMGEVFLIIACVAPFLKSLIEHMLRQMGLPVFQQKMRNLNSVHTFPDLPEFQGEAAEKDKRIKIDERKLEASGYTTSGTSTQSDESDIDGTRWLQGKATMSTHLDNV
jgi:hypothetical protein